MNKKIKPFLLFFMIILISLVLTGCIVKGKSQKPNIDIEEDVEHAQFITQSPQPTLKGEKENIFTEKVSLAVYKEPLAEVLPMIIDNFNFEKGVDPNIRVTLNVKDEPVEEALTKLLKREGLGYIKSSDNSIAITKQPIITFTAYNQPFYLIIVSMMTGYPYTLADGADEELNSLVTADFDELPLEIALDRLLAPLKLFWEKRDGVYYIFKEKEALFDIYFPLMAQSFEITSSRVGNTVGGSGTVSSTASSNNYTSGGMSSALSIARAKGSTSTIESINNTIAPFLTETGKFAIHKETGTIWIRDRADVVDRIGKFIDNLNKRLRVPLNIKGIITEVTLSEGHEYGIDWDKALSSTVVNGGFFGELKGHASVPVDKMSFNDVSSNTIAISASFTASGLASYIRALKEFGDVRVVSKPSLTVLNGAIGSLIVGNTLSYVAQSYSSTSSSDATTTSIIVKPLQTGLSFYVLPRIISDTEALLYISPEITALNDQRTIQAGDNAMVEAPSLTLKQTQTVVNIKNGSTILISGLMAEETTKTDKKVPILGEIPLLGGPFKYKADRKKTSELAIMVQVSW